MEIQKVNEGYGLMRMTIREICKELDAAATGKESPFSKVKPDGDIVPMGQEEATAVFKTYLDGMNNLERILFLTQFLEILPKQSATRLTFSRTIQDIKYNLYCEQSEYILSVIKEDPAGWWELLLIQIGTKELKDMIFLKLDDC